MKGPEAEKIINEQVQKCLDILVVKAREYAPGDEDRLHNFKVSAGLHGSTMQAALAGMMAKHTTSVYDMCHADKIFSQEKWDEKITDHINYGTKRPPITLTICCYYNALFMNKERS